MLTPELNTWLTGYFDTASGQNLLKKLKITTTDELVQRLQQASEQRSHQKHHVIVKQHLSTQHLGLVFSALIGSLLGTKTTYISQKDGLNASVLSEYFNMDALEIAQEATLQDMDVSYQLLAASETALDFEMNAVIHVLLNFQNTDLVLIDVQNAQLVKLVKALGLSCTVVNGLEADFPEQVQFKTLFWKRKSDENAVICQQITQMNTQLFEALYSLKREDLERLIDDFMYSEHLFEKISVLGEFTETILKNHLEKMKKAC